MRNMGRKLRLCLVLLLALALLTGCKGMDGINGAVNEFIAQVEAQQAANTTPTPRPTRAPTATPAPTKTPKPTATPDYHLEEDELPWVPV